MFFQRKPILILSYLIFTCFATSECQISISGFELSWKASTESVDFAFKTVVSQSDNVWIAFGFSKDSLMGDDCVCLCKIGNSVGSVEHYYTNGKMSPSVLDASNPSIGISNAQVKVDNGMMTCTFSRAIANDKVPNYFNSSSQFYLLMAKGLVDPSTGTIGYHTERASSNEKLSFNTEIQTTTTTTATSPLTTSTQPNPTSTATGFITSSTTSRSSSEANGFFGKICEQMKSFFNWMRNLFGIK